jgi:hypothetical protein
VARDETGAPLESLEAAGAALRALAASLGGGALRVVWAAGCGPR